MWAEVEKKKLNNSELVSAIVEVLNFNLNN